jgi:uncharacterized repeat protein (TIGR03803 family)
LKVRPIKNLNSAAEAGAMEDEMKQLLRFIAMVSLASAASCGHSAVTPVPAIPSSFALANADSLPRTVHVIPFYNYGKSGYEPAGVGGSGGLIGSATALYGATGAGGNTKCSTPFDPSSTTGCGIVYRLVPNASKPTYKLDVLHTFKGAPGDGAAAEAKLLLDKSGNLYGTTYFGGKYDGGTLFKLHPTSSGYTESILHSFGSGQDGEYPVSEVIEVKGMLYGTTVGGGTYVNPPFCMQYGGVPNGTCGTVYAVNPVTGAERVLHSFGGAGDGENPFAALLDVAGTLYGTTDLGGANEYCGTVFSIATDGSGERVVHSFHNAPSDGCDSSASLISVNGTLYGTTGSGGGNFCPHCEGTLFSVDLSTGTEQVLHEFGEPGDGSEPHAAVTDVQGVLYGTTTIGGLSNCESGFGCGTIFSFAPSPSNPSYNVLYRFKGGHDGAGPLGALLYSQRELYGTTTSGGKKHLGTGDKFPL